jgi:transcriptional antiterminator RfaH
LCNETGAVNLLNDSELIISGATLNEAPATAWYVAYTQPKREQVAADNLTQQGFEAYLPLYRTFQKSKRESLSGFEPMFPRYAFFRPGAGQSLSAARSTRGVAFVLSFGSQPATLKDDALEAIRNFERLRNSVDVHQLSPFRAGAKVKLAGENFCGVEGLVTSVSAKRVNVLVEILGGYRKISVGHQQLELA